MLPAAWCDLKGTWTRGLSRQPIKRTAYNFKAHGLGSEFAFPLAGNLIPLEMMKYFRGNGEGVAEGAPGMGEGCLLSPSCKTRKGGYKYLSRYLGRKSAGRASLRGGCRLPAAGAQSHSVPAAGLGGRESPGGCGRQAGPFLRRGGCRPERDAKCTAVSFGLVLFLKSSILVFDFLQEAG